MSARFHLHHRIFSIPCLALLFLCNHCALPFPRRAVLVERTVQLILTVLGNCAESAILSKVFFFWKYSPLSLSRRSFFNTISHPCSSSLSSLRTPNMLSIARQSLARSSCRRCISSSSVVSLPRNLPRQLQRPEYAPLASEPEQSSPPSSSSSRQALGSTATETASDEPWFLAPDLSQPTASTSASAEAPAQAPSRPLEPTAPVPLPPVLLSLHSLLTTGAVSGLISRPGDGDEFTLAQDSEEDGEVDEAQIQAAANKEPIAYIHPPSLEPEDAWTEWVIVVQVRGAAGGAVRKVAQEIGTFVSIRYSGLDNSSVAAPSGACHRQMLTFLFSPIYQLKHQRPPSTDSSIPSSAPHTQPIHYEGLVQPSSDAQGGNSTQRSGSSPISHGDGQWCLIDAGWCMIHVMTPQARARWNVEGVWAERARELARGERDSAELEQEEVWDRDQVWNEQEETSQRRNRMSTAVGGPRLRGMRRSGRI